MHITMKRHLHIYIISFKMQNLSQVMEIISRENKTIFLFDASVLIERNTGLFIDV